MNAARVLVVILNFNGIDDTLACLASLERQSFRDVAVLVIDNGSEVNALDRVAQAYPAVECLSLPENLGWAGGNNVGLRLAMARGHEFVCLLNNDTMLDDTALAELMRAAAIIGEPCLLHPAIAYFDQPEVWQLHPGLPADASARAKALMAEHDIVQMAWAYGACLLIPASLLDRIGLLDERFFLQLEEIDYFLRAQHLGIPSFCARNARMLHKESPSFGGVITPNKAYYQMRNGFLIAEKHHRTPRGFWSAARQSIWALYNQAEATGTRLTGWPGFARWLLSADPLARAARQGAGDYLRRRFGRRPSPVS